MQGEEETTFPRIRETTTIRLSHVSVSFFFSPPSLFALSPFSFSSFPFTSTASFHPLLPFPHRGVPPWTSVTRYFAGEIPPENPPPYGRSSFSLVPELGAAAPLSDHRDPIESKPLGGGSHRSPGPADKPTAVTFLFPSSSPRSTIPHLSLFENRPRDDGVWCPLVKTTPRTTDFVRKEGKEWKEGGEV